MYFHIFEPEGKDLTRERSLQLCTQPRASAYWYWTGVYNYDGWSSRVNLLVYYMKRFQFHIVFDKIQLFISQLYLHLPLKTYFTNFLLLRISFCFLTSSFIKTDIVYQQTNSFYTLFNCTKLIKKSEFNCRFKFKWFIPYRVSRLLFYKCYRSWCIF